MRFLRFLLLVLVAVGICGGLYVGLYAGMHLAGMAMAQPEPQGAEPLPPPSTAPAREEDPREVLQRRLSEVGTGGAAAVASAGAPPAAPTSIVPMPYRTWLPPPSTPAAPRPLPGDAGRKLKAGPAVDVPPVADAAALLPLPAAVRLPAVLPAAVASPDPGQVPVNWVASRPGPRLHGDLSTDPTAEESRRSATAARPPLRQTPAPFLKLSIPDPLAGAPAMKNPPPDDDPPVNAPAPPARVTVPTP